MTKQANIHKWVEKLNTSDRYKYNKRTVTILLSALADGLGRLVACQKAGIHHSTLIDWIDKKSGFSEAIKKAEAIGLLVQKDISEQRIIREKDWKAHAWHLERRFPNEYALRSKFEHTIQIPKIIVENDEQAAKLKELGEK